VGVCALALGLRDRPGVYSRRANLGRSGWGLCSRGEGEKKSPYPELFHWIMDSPLGWGRSSTKVCASIF